MTKTKTTPSTRDFDAEKNPRVGDEWKKVTDKGRVVTRKVVELKGKKDHALGFVGDVTYLNERGFTKSCWCTTWTGWVRGAELVRREQSPRKEALYDTVPGPAAETPPGPPTVFGEEKKTSKFEIRIPASLHRRIKVHRERCEDQGVVARNFSFACRAAIEAVLEGKTSDDPRTWGSCPVCKTPREPSCPRGHDNEDYAAEAHRTASEAYFASEGGEPS